ncbi:MAG: hypothetical protein U0T81_14165 [Saprospiraceae bacterium]
MITAGIVLEGSNYPEDSYTVVVYDETNHVIPGGAINGSYLGKKLKVQVTHLCSNITCWGYVLIEDKYIPNLVCRVDTPRLAVLLMLDLKQLDFHYCQVHMDCGCRERRLLYRKEF